MKPLLLAALLAQGAVAAAPPDTARFDALVASARAVMMDDPQQALARARQAEAAAAHILTPRAGTLATARAEWLQGEALSRLDESAQAAPLLARAQAAVAKIAPADQLHGDILLSSGWVAETRGHIAESLHDFQRAFAIYRGTGDARGQAKALGNIAGIYQDAGDTPRALRYYTQAAELYRGDTALTIAANNNIGEILRSQGHAAAAEAKYRLALAAARSSNSALLQASILSNIATTRITRGDLAGAERIGRRALALTALPAAHDERPFVWGVLARVALARGDGASAAQLIGRTFAGVNLATTTLPYRDFHELAERIFEQQGDTALALQHLRALKRLDDNIRAVTASTNAALLAARFDFSTQNLRIVQLQANRARLHVAILIGAVAAVSLLSGLMLWGLLSTRRSRNQIRETNSRLTKALQAKTDFLAMTSHEIRTPLNGILGMAQVMLAEAGLSPRARGQLEVVRGAGETMRSLVDDILDLSKMETGKLSIHPTPVALPALVRDMVGLWRGRAEAKGLAITLDLDQCPAGIEADGDRLRQILGNLLSNAVKFTERGAVAVTVAAVGERLEVVVADTGIGIASEHHSIIFDKFQQADGSTSRRFGGTGLGLAICRNLAEAMDGGIALASRPGEGSRFTLHLPLRLATVAAPPVAVAETGGVLLLEPNPLAQRMLAKLLAPKGPVKPVSSAAALVAALADAAPRWVVAQAAAAQDDYPALLAAMAASGAQLVLLATPDELPAATAVAGAIVLQKPVQGDQLLAALADPPLATAA